MSESTLQRLFRFFGRAGKKHKKSAGTGRLKPVDFRGLLDNNPCEAHRRCESVPILLNCEASRCRTLFSVALPADGSRPNPLVGTIRDFWAGAASEYGESRLKRYYESNVPKSAGDALGLPAGALPHRLPSEQAELPWRGVCSRDTVRRRIKHWKREMTRLGLTFPTESGAPVPRKTWGPMPELLGCAEFRRLIDTAESIRANGYRSDLGKQHIRVDLLVDARKNPPWVVLVGSGMHRVAALEALEYSMFPVQIRPSDVFDRSSAERWPAVTENQLTAGQAISVFDRIFAGEQPPFFSWNER